VLEWEFGPTTFISFNQRKRPPSSNFKLAHYLGRKNSYQALNAGDMARVYGDRIIKTILGVSVAFSDLKDTATLRRER